MTPAAVSFPAFFANATHPLVIAEREGAKARATMVPRTRSPYGRATDEHAAWLRGYDRRDNGVRSRGGV